MVLMTKRLCCWKVGDFKQNEVKVTREALDCNMNFP